MRGSELGRLGPPSGAANEYAYKRLLGNCSECARCGEMTHYKAPHKPGFVIQANIGGRIMGVRRAMYMAAFPNKVIQSGRRITSKCSNPHCIDPAKLYQSTAGQLLKTHYEKGIRDRAEAAAHLASFQRRHAKVDTDMVLKILHDDRGGAEAADEYGISATHYNAIQRGAARRTANPFAGLMA